MNPDLEQLKSEVADLRRLMRDHFHDGLTSARINLFSVFGKIEVVSVAPSGKPTDLSGQFKIYTNGATLRLYWYDTTAGVWHYVTASA